MNATDILSKIATQIPDLIALIIVIMIMFKHLDKRDKMSRELHQEHLDARELSREQYREMVHENHVVMEKISDALIEFSKIVEHCRFKAQ